MQPTLSLKGTCPFLASEMLLGLLIVRAERGNVDRDQSQHYPDHRGSARLSLWTSCPHFPSEAEATGTCCRETTSEAPPLPLALGNSSVVASTSASRIHNPINNNNNTTTAVTAATAIYWALPWVTLWKNLPALWETWVRSLDREDPLEKAMATHSSILAWRIPTDKGAWQATVLGVAKSWTWLSN